MPLDTPWPLSFPIHDAGMEQAWRTAALCSGPGREGLGSKERPPSPGVVGGGGVFLQDHSGQRAGRGHPSQVDRTEVVRSSLHPMSAKAFTLHYYFEEAQRLRFEVCDTHGPGSLSCQASDFLGAMERTLGQVGPAPWEGGGWRGSRLVPRAAVAWGSLITPSLWSRDHRGPSREHPSSACLQAPLGKRLFSKKTLIFGVSLVAQWLMNATRTHEVRVRFLALLSGLRTQRCRELWCRLQMRLRSHIAVSLA